MASEEVKIRRDTQTNLKAAVPVQGELGMDTTNTRLIIGNGSTSGGYPLPNYHDIQKNTFSYATTGGVVNAYTLTFDTHWAPQPYVAGHEYKFTPHITNTASSTLNVGGRGVVTIRKVENFVLANLIASDLVAGVPYIVIYNGSVWVLASGAGSLSDHSVTNVKLAQATPGSFITALQMLKAPCVIATGGAWLKYGEIKVPRDGTYTVRTHYARTSGGGLSLQIWKNGVALGANHTIGGGGFAEAWINENLAFSAGDLCQLYANCSTSVNAYNSTNDLMTALAYNQVTSFALMEAAPISWGNNYLYQTG